MTDRQTAFAAFCSLLEDLAIVGSFARYLPIWGVEGLFSAENDEISLRDLKNIIFSGGRVYAEQWSRYPFHYLCVWALSVMAIYVDLACLLTFGKWWPNIDMFKYKVLEEIEKRHK